MLISTGKRRLLLYNCRIGGKRCFNCKLNRWRGFTSASKSLVEWLFQYTCLIQQKLSKVTSLPGWWWIINEWYLSTLGPHAAQKCNLAPTVISSSASGTHPWSNMAAKQKSFQPREPCVLFPIKWTILSFLKVNLRKWYPVCLRNIVAIKIQSKQYEIRCLKLAWSSNKKLCYGWKNYTEGSLLARKLVIHGQW